MKKFVFAGTVFCVPFFYFSCSRDKTQEPISANCKDSTITYNLRVRAILDYNCATPGTNCHENGTSNGSTLLFDYASAKNSFQTRPVLCSVNQQSSCLPMPDGAPKLASALIDTLQCWVERGYPQ